MDDSTYSEINKTGIEYTIEERVFEIARSKKKKSLESKNLMRLSKASSITHYPSLDLSNFPVLISPRYSGSCLENLLRNHYNSIRIIPIEYYEIKLYKLSKFFYLVFHGIDFNLNFITQAHHLISLKQSDNNLTPPEKEILEEKLKIISFKDLYVFQKYKLLSGLLRLIGNLAVKWKIFDIYNYEFRYKGRSLNVKPLNLNNLNHNIFSLEVIWFAYISFFQPLAAIATQNLFEQAKILKNSLTELSFVLLRLNPNPTYQIKKAVAYKSKEYVKYNKNVIPEQNIDRINHQSLNYTKNFLINCFYSNPVLDNVYELIKDFELIYRSFEKELIKVFLLSLSYK